MLEDGRVVQHSRETRVLPENATRALCLGRASAHAFSEWGPNNDCEKHSIADQYRFCITTIVSPFHTIILSGLSD